MAEKKSKYLIWLETLHREYTDRTCITQMGKQAASLRLLAEMYEIRCRFGKILERMQKEAFQLDDDGLNYEEWYNPEKWKRGENLTADEDLRETFGFKPESPLAQTYANELITPFGEQAKFNQDNYRNVVSSLFILDQIVDSQRMEIAIDNELKKLQRTLLDINNAKQKTLPKEQYAAYFKKLRNQYKNYITKPILLTEHKKWMEDIDGECDREEMRVRRASLLLDIFDSGFADDLKREYHRKAEDDLGFKNYYFEKWEDRTDNAVKYFAAFSKLCPFDKANDMIDFSHNDRLGKYVIKHHIELSIVNAFIKNMELIRLVQSEMQRLVNPELVDEVGDTPVELFVERVKKIMLKAEDDNGIKKENNSRRNPKTYTYYVDGKGFCEVMDDLFENHEKELRAYLKDATVETATSLKYVAPFVGFVLDKKLYSPPDMPKNEFKKVFDVVYEKTTSADTKMSDKSLKEDAEDFFKIVEEIMLKHKDA